jgi:hypothetical protein
MLAVTSRLFKSCPPDKADFPAQPVQSTAWVLNSPWGHGFSLSPVDTFMPFVARESTSPQSLIVCADAPFTFRQPEKVRQFRVEQDFKNVKLADFVVRP